MREEKRTKIQHPLTPSSSSSSYSYKKTIYRTFSEQTWKTLLFSVFCDCDGIHNVQKNIGTGLYTCVNPPRHLQEQYSSFCKILVFIFLFFFVKNTNKMKNIICALRKKKESRLSGKIMFPSNYKNCPVSMYLSVLYFFWF